MERGKTGFRSRQSERPVSMRTARQKALSAILWMVLIMGVNGLPAQEAPTGCRLLEGVATPGDELVLGTDGWQIVLLAADGGGQQDWTDGETRIADLAASPWRSGSLSPWGRVPTRDEAWSNLGEILHVDIHPGSGMAIISALDKGRFAVWLSAERPDGLWTSPWAVPVLMDWSGQAAFGMFDVQKGREGDLLVALRPDEPDSANGQVKGVWSGGFDIVRIPRRGNYGEASILSTLNTSGNEWALAPHPTSGGWLASDGLDGHGGVDPWWVPTLPEGKQNEEQKLEYLEGHVLTIRCDGRPLEGVEWTLEDARTGMPVTQLVSNTEGRVALDGLPADMGTRWVAQRPPTKECRSAMAVWSDAEGRVVQRFTLMGDVWRLNMLSVLAIDIWHVNAEDRSRLPELIPLIQPHRPADWVVFHEVGSPVVPIPVMANLKSWARRCRDREDCQVLIMGHASPEGNAGDNIRLAKERARRVAVQLEFAGFPPQRIRVESHGSERPMIDCPDGVKCPEGVRERSRRTELYLIPGRLP